MMSRLDRADWVRYTECFPAEGSPAHIRREASRVACTATIGQMLVIAGQRGQQVKSRSCPAAPITPKPKTFLSARLRDADHLAALALDEVAEVERSAWFLKLQERIKAQRGAASTRKRWHLHDAVRCGWKANSHPSRIVSKDRFRRQLDKFPRTTCGFCRLNYQAHNKP